MSKNKLSINTQLTKMKSSGIKFDLMSEESAKEFISENTYYFKIKVFQRNYNKNKDGKYVNLDFAYLKDFSTIDMHFRRLILSMVLTIEHTLKVKLNADISNNQNEDGYTIVNDFLNCKKYQYIAKSLYEKAQSPYTCELIKKYCSYTYTPGSTTPYYFKCPYWVLFEVLSFGNFIKFYNFYYEVNKKENPIKELLYPIKCLRNACAHNNCVLHSLKKSDHPDFAINKKVYSYVSKINSISKTSRFNCMSVPVIHDFTALLMVFLNVVKSRAVLEHTINNLQDFLERFHKNFDNYYNSNNEIKKTYIFFEKLLDNFKESVYNNIGDQKP